MKHTLLFLYTLTGLTMISCSNDDVPDTEPGEMITDVRLIFNPLQGPPLIYGASDPDGDGPDDLEADEVILLKTHTVYQLFIELENLTTNEDITDQIKAAGDEHMFFFGFTDNLFANPAGDGNLDVRESQTVEYLDSDDKGQPLGLITSWLSGGAKEGTFQTVLKHQPGIKTETSTSSDGSSDLDITWQVSIE